MDQIKIGKFIAEERKAKKYTQRELADKLSISDKTISKWERGNGFPEVSLLLPLCNELEITVNELLSGERLQAMDYKKKAEENMVNLVKEAQESKKKIIMSAMVSVLVIVAAVPLFVVAGMFEMQVWTRVLLMGIGFVIMVMGIAIACVLDREEYQTINNCGKVTIDNIRRSLSTFFSWLEEEDYIIKSPMKRIHKVKTAVIVKDTIPDEKIEILRDNCNNLRDRAMIDFLLSTGIRVGELVRLNIDDIDFSERECVVYGKGDKERKAYFDAKTKIHLLNYIESRTDNNIALFVSLNKPHSRLTESGVELRLREMGKKLGVEKVHPHKFRRTMATRAIEKGMPIEQVQKILGHEQIDTTLRYAMVNQNNVKLSHRKYIS